MSNVPCYSVLALFAVANKIICTTIVISAPLSVHHSSEVKIIAMKIIFTLFLANAVHK